MRTIAVLLVSLAVSASAQAQLADFTNCLLLTKAEASDEKAANRCLSLLGVPDPGDEARLESHRAWRECLAPRIAELDDGVSPAIDIAKAAAPMCSKEWRDWANAQWMVKETKQKLAAGVSTFGAENAAVGVLRARAAKRTAVTRP